MRLPPQDLDCPDPAGCPVVPVDDLPPVPAGTLDAALPLFRAYDGRWGYDEPNPGHGDARFSPFDAVDGPSRVATTYLAQTPAGALLETVFHDVHHDADRLVFEDQLRDTLLASVRLPAPLRLADLRDEALAGLGLARDRLVASPAEHYPCTRRVARHLHAVGADGAPVQGIVWHSRQAELAAAPPTLVLVVFADRYPAGRGDWPRIAPGSQNLFEGPGRLRVDQLALDLGATVVS